MQQKSVPQRLWDFGLQWIADTMNVTARGTDLEKRTGFELITGITPDISERLDFDFYDLCWYWDMPHADIAEENRKLGRIVAIGERVLSDLSYRILIPNGQVIARSTVQRMIDDDLKDPSIATKINEFTQKLQERLDDANHIISDPLATDYIQDTVIDNDALSLDNTTTHNEVNHCTPEAYDEYLGAELILNLGTEEYGARVVKRVKDDDGNPIGIRNDNL